MHAKPRDSLTSNYEGNIVKQSDKIIELLEDRTFPQIVLLDGAWGSGKTHFVRTHLINNIKTAFDQDVYFFSLYGMANIEDFRDKIISLSLTNTENATKLSKLASKLVDGISSNFGGKGVGAILNAAAGAYKYKLLENFNNCVLILDDLERVTDETLIKNILGECLNLAESKNIKVIVVANEDKLNCKADIEKVFADKFKFGYTTEEVVTILSEEYKLNDDLANELLLKIASVNSQNIRVLKRALSKFTRLQSEVNKIDNVVSDLALSRILGDVIRLCCAKFEHSYSKEQIIEAIESRLLTQMVNEVEDVAPPESKVLNNVVKDIYYGTNDKLVNYCCDGLYEFTDIQAELNLPVKKTLLDSMKTTWTQVKLTDSEFKQGVLDLEDYITSATKIDIYEWFSFCDVYVYMLDHKIIKPNHFSKSNILELCSNVDIKRFKVPTKEDDLEFRYFGSFADAEVSKKFYAKKNELGALSKKNMNAELTDSFKNSWNGVKNRFTQELMHKPVFNKLSADVLKESLINWTVDEVFQFSLFIQERYNFSNLGDFFETELDALKELSAMLEDLENELGTGRKVSSLIELRNTLSKAHSKIEEQLHLNALDES